MNRPNRRGGGTAVYWRKQIKAHPIKLQIVDNVEVAAIETEINVNPIRFISVYCPPNQKADNLEILDSEIPLVIRGDFNVDINVLKNLEVSRNSKQNYRAVQIRNLIKANVLKTWHTSRIILTHTSRKKSTPDYFLTSKNIHVVPCEQIENFLDTDHECIILDIKLPLKNLNAKAK